MEQALKRIDADVLLATEETGEPVAAFMRPDQDARALEAAAVRFARLDRLSANLKMGPLQQLVTVGSNGAELSVRNAEAKTVSVASAPTLDRSFLAQECVQQLQDEQQSFATQ